MCEISHHVEHTWSEREARESARQNIRVGRESRDAGFGWREESAARQNTRVGRDEGLGWLEENAQAARDALFTHERLTDKAVFECRMMLRCSMAVVGFG